jgi:RNA polymerase sigma-70 factor (ECF subfamily)
MAILGKNFGKDDVRIEDRDVFSALYEQSHLDVFRYAKALCGGNQDEAEEFTADAFMRAWKKRGTFKGNQSEALRWLLRITSNALIDLRRPEGRHPEVELQYEVGEGKNDEIEDMLGETEQLDQILVVISELPRMQNEIIVLRFTLDWRIKDIAEYFDLSENYVSVILRRSFARIQFRLNQLKIGTERRINYG